MTSYWLVMRAIDPANLFVPANPGIVIPITVVKSAGDPVGFCPMFASKEDAQKAYPNDPIEEVRGRDPLEKTDAE